jgi:antitoxin MazE
MISTGFAMGKTIRSKIIDVGNSGVIRIPRLLLEQAGLTGEVELIMEGDKLIIQASRRPRQGWETQFSAMAERRDDKKKISFGFVNPFKRQGIHTSQALFQ